MQSRSLKLYALVLSDFFFSDTVFASSDSVVFGNILGVYTSRVKRESTDCRLMELNLCFCDSLESL